MSLMNLAEFFDPDLIELDIKAKTKMEAVDALARIFCKKYPQVDQQSILEAVIEREQLGSTSFGRGFAFPHARTDAVKSLFLTLGIVRDGLEETGPDQTIIKVICLLLTPRNISRLYLQTLSGLANLARRQGILEKLTVAKSADQVIGIVDESDIVIKKDLTVADIMSDKVISVGPDESLRTVANIMFKYNFDGVPVVDGEGRLIGDVSSRELIKSALPNYENLIVNRHELEPFEELLRRKDDILVKDIMRKDVPTIDENALPIEAAAAILTRNVERIMVVRNSQLVGIVSAADIIFKIIRG